MKMSVLLDNNVEQVVLTPENDFEKNLVAHMGEPGLRTVTVKKGSFAECAGGWQRYYPYDNSVFIVFRKPEE